MSPGKKGSLGPRTFQLFLNHRPCFGPKTIRAILNDLYRDFKIAEGTIPYVLMHIIAPVDSYDLRLSADLRKMFFKPKQEDIIL